MAKWLFPQHRLRAGKVGQNPAGAAFPHHSALGNTDHQVLPGFAGAPFGASILPPAGKVPLAVLKIYQAAEVGIRHKIDVPAPAAVAAVRSPGRHIFFPVEGDLAIASIPGLNGDSRFIYKHHYSLL